MAITLIVLSAAIALTLILAWLQDVASLRGDKLEHSLDNQLMPAPASKLAQELIDAVGLRGLVTMGEAGVTRGFNHYQSDDSTVNLTSETGTSNTLAAGLIAAHEVGHACVDHTSRLHHYVADFAAYAQAPIATKIAAAVFAVAALTGWQAGMQLALMALCAQMVAATVILAVEARATRYGLIMLEGAFQLSPGIVQVLRKCGRAALTNHAHDLALPAALLLLFSQLTPFAASPLLAVPLFALIACGCLFLSCFFTGKRNSQENATGRPPRNADQRP